MGRHLADRRRWGRRTVLAAVCAAGVGMASVGQDKPTGRTPGCTDSQCHSAIVQRRVLHSPLQVGACTSCHKYVSPEDHVFQLAAEGRALCDRCHTKRDGAVVHAPVADGDCLACHDVHGSEHRMILRTPSDRICAECHEPQYVYRKFVHGPVGSGACVACHDPHSSGQAFLLTRSPDRLCSTCHRDVVPTGLERRYRHSPMDEGCSRCHDPHASDHRFQLRDTQQNVCFECHDGMRKLVTESSVVHGPVLEERGCGTCHNPHYSSRPALQRVGQQELCLGCHDRSIELLGDRTLTDMTALLAENPDHHGPIRQGECAGCHDPHAQDTFRLLRNPYPADFYAPFDLHRYDLCFRCHVPDMVLEPSGATLTGFRDGELNLHWLHVNQEKGRTCRACHEVHASKRPFHIREAVPFGPQGWMLQINFEQTATGGSCAPACHRARSYDRTSSRAATAPDPSAGGPPSRP